MEKFKKLKEVEEYLKDNNIVFNKHNGSIWVGSTRYKDSNGKGSYIEFYDCSGVSIVYEMGEYGTCYLRDSSNLELILSVNKQIYDSSQRINILLQKLKEDGYF
jgi:hypothetical protein